MRPRTPLLATLPPELFPLSVVIQEQTSERNEYSGQRVPSYTDLLTTNAFITTGARGAVRDQELRKDDRDHVRVQGILVLDRDVDVPHGSRAVITYPPGLGNKVEYWRVVGVEKRPLGAYTRCAVEQFDGSVRR